MIRRTVFLDLSESGDETGPEEQETPPDMHLPESSSQEGLQESQDLSFDTHLPSTQKMLQSLYMKALGKQEAHENHKGSV